jgi:hypothetical protein
MTHQYMTDPSLLEALHSQQYLVLRPVAQVASFYDEEQSALRDRLPDSISYPNTGHVTLRGFYEPDRVQILRAALATWAAAQPTIALQVDAVDGFPPPFQVLIARLQRSGSLLEAYASLTRLLDSTDFHHIGELPLEQWVFHLSLIYAQTLEESTGTCCTRARGETFPTVQPSGSRPPSLFGTTTRASTSRSSLSLLPTATGGNARSTIPCGGYRGCRGLADFGGLLADVCHV